MKRARLDLNQMCHTVLAAMVIHVKSVFVSVFDTNDNEDDIFHNDFCDNVMLMMMTMMLTGSSEQFLV